MSAEKYIRITKLLAPLPLAICRILSGKVHSFATASCDTPGISWQSRIKFRGIGRIPNSYLAELLDT